jgi:hypothetical protein
VLPHFGITSTICEYYNSRITFRTDAATARNAALKQKLRVLICKRPVHTRARTHTHTHPHPHPHPHTHVHTRAHTCTHVQTRTRAHTTRPRFVNCCLLFYLLHISDDGFNVNTLSITHSHTLTHTHTHALCGIHCVIYPKDRSTITQRILPKDPLCEPSSLPLSEHVGAVPLGLLALSIPRADGPKCPQP